MPVDKEVIKSRLSDVKASIKELERLTSKPFSELTIDEKYSIRYNLIVLVEALVSLCTHIAVEGIGVKPRTYRESLRIIGERLGVKCLYDLLALVGLRNILVHRYWEVDDKIVYDSVKNDFKCLNEFLNKIVEKYL